MASFLVGWFATVIVRALFRSIPDDTLHALVAQGDRQAALFDPPFSIVDKPDLPEPLLFCDAVRGLNMLPVALHKVSLICAMMSTNIQELFKRKGAQVKTFLHKL
eukprot:15328326-Ditylum_brightwellii.AAC.1